MAVNELPAFPIFKNLLLDFLIEFNMNTTAYRHFSIFDLLLVIFHKTKPLREDNHHPPIVNYWALILQPFLILGFWKSLLCMSHVDLWTRCRGKIILNLVIFSLVNILSLEPICRLTKKIIVVFTKNTHSSRFYFDFGTIINMRFLIWTEINFIQHCLDFLTWRFH